jgi:low temperature requirement protein LtrA
MMLLGINLKNILELAGAYFDRRVTLFTLVFVIVAAVEAGFFLYQLRLKRQVMRATVKANATAREVANETRALLARLNEYDLQRELWIAITEAMKKKPTGA